MQTQNILWPLGKGNLTQALAFTHALLQTHTRSVSRHHIKKTATPILGLLSVLSVALQLLSNRLTASKNAFSNVTFSITFDANRIPHDRRKNRK